MKPKSVKRIAQQVAESWEARDLEYLLSYLLDCAKGHKNGKTREEIFQYMRGIGRNIEDKDGRKLRNMLEELVRQGFPCFTSPTYGHYYANTIEDVDLCISVRKSMIEGHKLYCNRAQRAWDKEQERKLGGGPLSD